jgi:hypothetical protein
VSYLGESRRKEHTLREQQRHGGGGYIRYQGFASIFIRKQSAKVSLLNVCDMILSIPTGSIRKHGPFCTETTKGRDEEEEGLVISRYIGRSSCDEEGEVQEQQKR